MYGTKATTLQGLRQKTESLSSKFGDCLLLMAVNYAMKMRVVTFYTCFRLANSVGSHADACDSVYYITLN